ncbi:hypothetical protein CERZMDRAFT_80783 [Cercospora zeae-maydis SCOH1-5]|uniref:Uncharacterized protein n=1 Tax=Cercospora zeae-maydis SCOH1-5 TaxID=717836 RepID=A0A6A6FTU4_9PEZI|nr:hypothetical protein CERZMDRAFT_80783 [Cercospora zeae-maydis SCOH1-5]
MSAQQSAIPAVSVWCRQAVTEARVWSSENYNAEGTTLCVSRRRTLHGQLVRLRGIDSSKAWNRKDRHAFVLPSPPWRQMTPLTHPRRHLSAARVLRLAVTQQEHEPPFGGLRMCQKRLDQEVKLPLTIRTSSAASPTPQLCYFQILGATSPRMRWAMLDVPACCAVALLGAVGYSIGLKNSLTLERAAACSCGSACFTWTFEHARLALWNSNTSVK